MSPFTLLVCSYAQQLSQLIYSYADAHVPVGGIERQSYGEHDRNCDEDGPPDEILHTHGGKKEKKCVMQMVNNYVHVYTLLSVYFCPSC